MTISEKLSTLAENEQKVFNSGKKAQHDEFWDVFQDYGNRVSYIGAFAKWNKDIFKPKYNMQPTNAYYMFDGFKDNIDMVEYLNNLGITLDFSNCTSFTNFMFWSKISRMGIVDSTAASSITFYYAYMLKTIDLLILKADGTQSFNFAGCGALKDITIQGVIGKTCDMQSCPLSKESIISVINALSTTTAKLTITFKKTAINNAFGINVDDATTYPEGSEYYVLRNTKSNWTFSYV